jgi:signal transduction histidine kinase
LNPNNDSFQQLQNRMVTFTAMILTPQNITYNFIANEELKKIQFTSEKRKNIFLIFKESLYNLVKYAACKNVCVELILQRNTFIMIIRDDGKGFDEHQISSNDTSPATGYSGGNGIKNMKVRADDLNGKLCIYSKRNQGTSVQLTIPL